jgi:hypothetical protein
MKAKKEKGQKVKVKKAPGPSIEKLALVDFHPNHDRHLCHIVNLRNFKTAAKLSKDAKYICFLCGRAAKSEKNLCEPLKI